MRTLSLLACCLGSTFGIAQDRQPSRAPVLVLGEVQQGSFPAKIPVQEILIRSKPKPQAHLGRAIVLRASGAFAVVPFAAGRAFAAGRSPGRPRLGPGDVLVVPGMPTDKTRAATIPIRALRAAAHRLQVSKTPSDTEVAIRLFLLRHESDPARARVHLERIIIMRNDSIRLLAGLRDLARNGHENVRPVATAAQGKLMKLATFCVNDCFPAHTLAHTPGGGRAIESLRTGDRVLDADGQARRVHQLHRSHARVLVRLDFHGSQIHTTPGHRFLTRDRGWVAADALRVGDDLRSGHDVIELRAITRRKPDAPVVVYTLELAGEARGAFQVGTARIVVAAKAATRAPVAHH